MNFLNKNNIEDKKKNLIGVFLFDVYLIFFLIRYFREHTDDISAFDISSDRKKAATG
jgi:hypothetical protein